MARLEDVREWVHVGDVAHIAIDAPAGTVKTACGAHLLGIAVRDQPERMCGQCLAALPDFRAYGHRLRRRKHRSPTSHPSKRDPLANHARRRARVETWKYKASEAKPTLPYVSCLDDGQFPYPMRPVGLIAAGNKRSE